MHTYNDHTLRFGILIWIRFRPGSCVLESFYSLKMPVFQIFNGTNNLSEIISLFLIRWFWSSFDLIPLLLLWLLWSRSLTYLGSCWRVCVFKKKKKNPTRKRWKDNEEKSAKLKTGRNVVFFGKKIFDVDVKQCDKVDECN